MSVSDCEREVDEWLTCTLHVFLYIISPNPSLSLPALHCIMDSPPPPPPSSSSSTGSTSVLVLALSVLGILTISLLLFLYYLFITKRFHISWRRPTATGTVSRRWHHHHYHRHNSISTGRGLSDSAIQSIPTVYYKKCGSRGHDHDHTKKESFCNHDRECAVCITEFDEGERIRLLPDCLHVFHLDCIDVWLQSNANCPLCRSPVTANAILPGFPFTEQVVAGADANDTINNEDIVIEIGDDNEFHVTGTGVHHQARGSMADECIDSRIIRRKLDDRLGEMPIRRSFSMDSSNDKQLYLALQKIIHHQNQSLLANNGDDVAIEDSGGGGGSGGSNYAATGKQLRRGFFSFNHHNRCSRSRSAVLPI